MNRETVLKNIRNAKNAHLKWVKRAKHLVLGLPISNEMIPLNPTSCEFGSWLYRDGFKCKVLSRLANELNEIEKNHVRLHDVYLHIYQIYFVDEQRSFLSKLVLGKKKIVSYREKKDAQLFYNQLEFISRVLNQNLDDFEKSVRVVSDAVIEKCVA